MATEKRLIDRETLIDLVLNHPKPYRKDFYAMLKNAPTVDAVEVVHGRWEKTSETMLIYRCSICKERNLFKSGSNVLSNFCPHCGADMRGDGNG